MRNEPQYPVGDAVPMLQMAILPEKLHSAWADGRFTATTGTARRTSRRTIFFRVSLSPPVAQSESFLAASARSDDTL